MRIYIQTKHVIEYGTNGFNYQQGGLYGLLCEVGCSVSSNDEDCPEYGNEWEINENELASAVEKIRTMPEEDILSHFDDPDAVSSKEEVVELLESFLETGDHSDGYYHFSWF